MSSYSSLTNDESVDLNYGYYDQLDVDSATIANLEVTGTETVGQLIDSGLSTNALVGSSATKQLQSLAIVNTNGASTTLVDSTLNVSNEQNLSTTGQVTFAQLTDTGLTATALVGSSGTKQLQSLTLASNNGMVAGVSGSVLTISTSQDVRTSAKPTYNQLQVINNNNCVMNTPTFTPTGTGNTALGGFQSMGYNRHISSSNNTSAGTFALQSVTSGSTNTAYGYNTLKILTTGANQTAVGGEAGLQNTGSTNTFLGAQSDAVGALSNTTAVGYQAKALASNTMVLGNSAVTSLAPGSDGLCDLGSSTKKMNQVYSKGLTLDNLTASTLVASDTSKNLQSVNLITTNANGTNNSLSFSGGTLTLASSLNQSVDVGSNPSYNAPYITGVPAGSALMVSSHPLPAFRQMYGLPPTYGKIMVGSFDASNSMTFWQIGTIVGSSNITASFTSDLYGLTPQFTFNTVQPIATGSTPTFAGLTLTGLTANSLLYVNSSKQLTPLGISNSNGSQTTLNTTSGLLEFSNSQNVSTAGSPFFSNLATNGEIHFQAGVTDADFVLKSDTSNGLQFYDMARGSQMRIFQGQVRFGVGLYLPTSGGTPSALDYYEEFTHVTNWDGPFTAVSGNVVLTRIGKNITARFPQILGLCSTASTLNMVTAFPARFRPSANMRLTGGMVQTNATTNDYAVFFLTSFGSINIYNGPMNSFSNVGATIGVSNACCITWSV